MVFFSFSSHKNNKDFSQLQANVDLKYHFFPFWLGLVTLVLKFQQGSVTKYKFAKKWSDVYHMLETKFCCL